jgi:O-antigen biosynthesis protein
MKLSVVIPAFNHLSDVMTCLNSLQAMQAANVEYLVQDDCSNEYIGTAVIPNALVQRNKQNIGFGANVNAGAQRAAGDIIMTINQDVFAVRNLSENWDSAILRAFEDESVGIVGARLLFPDGRIQSAGGLFDARGTPYHRCFLWRNRGYHEISTAQEVSWVTGAALAIRRELFERVGGFDTDYMNGYFEDTDLCLKVRELGYKIWYEPACTFVHSVGSTGGSPNFTRNALRFKRRWVDSGLVQADSPAVLARYW